MNSFGLYEGGRVRVVRAAPFAGPLLIEDAGNGARIMAARGMAAQVEVREVADDPPR
jgi:Fe2+ transport system protein FeoA